MKHHNPHTPIMVREALNTQPRVFARYEFGREKVEELGGEFSVPVLLCSAVVVVGKSWLGRRWRLFRCTGFGEDGVRETAVVVRFLGNKCSGGKKGGERRNRRVPTPQTRKLKSRE
jgi:hypothetical protein